MKDKGNFNLIINIFLFLSLALLSGIGFLLKYSGLIMRDFAAQGVSVTVSFMNMKYRDWGNIHFIVSIIFLSLLFIHIILNWNKMASAFNKMMKNKFFNFITAFILIAVAVILLIFPFIIKPKITPRQTSSCSGTGCTSCITNK